VSRSYLQADSNVKKISTYISKKVADKLHEIFKEDRVKFAEKWKDIEVFVKYGMISDEKFHDKAVDFCLLRNIQDETFTLDEYREKVAPNQTDKNGNLVYIYAADKDHQDSFIRSAEKKGYDVLHFGAVIDSHFVGHLERKIEKTTWKRVDAEAIDKLVEKDHAEVSLLDEAQQKDIVEVYKQVATDLGATVRAEALGSDEMPVVIVKPEFMRRMREQAMLGGMGGGMKDIVSVVVNSSHPLAEKVLEKKTSDSRERLAKQLLDLARLSQGMLTGRDLTEFIERSVNIVGKK
jgi:molecular chaperone HtpG